MFCVNCGKQIQDGANFCPFCGAQGYREENNNIEQNVVDRRLAKEKNKKKMLIIIAIVTCLVVIITGIFLLQRFLNSSDDTIEIGVNSAEKYYNSYNMSGNGYEIGTSKGWGLYVAKNDKYLFYINDNGNIVRTNDYFASETIIVEDKKVDGIYLYGEKIYYHDFETGLIFSADINGENEKQLVDVKTLWFTIANGQLYFVEGYVDKYEIDKGSINITYGGNYALSQSSLNGTGYKTIISQGVDFNNLFVDDDKIVYTENLNQAICTVNLDGTNRKVLHENTNEELILDYKVYKDKLYYQVYITNNDDISGIYYLDIKTGEKKKIVSVTSSSVPFTFWNDFIIYEVQNDISVHMCKLDGSNDVIIIDDDSAYLTQPIVMGDYMYYYIDPHFSTEVLAFNLKEETSNITNDNATSQRITSLEDFTTFLTSDHLLTEQKVECMSLPMVIWCYDEFFQVWDDEQEIVQRLKNHNPKTFCEDMNEKVIEWESEKVQLISVNWKETDASFYDLYIDEMCGNNTDSELYSMLSKERNNIQRVWVSTDYTYKNYSGKIRTVNHFDYDNEIYVFLIDGEYYWCFIECY